MYEMLQVSIVAILYLGVLSYLFKAPNPFYDLVEAIFIGVGTGNIVLVTLNTINTTGIKAIMAGRFLMIIPVIVGLLMFTRLTKEYAWMSRYSVSIMVGVGLGVLIVPAIKVSLLTQLIATIEPLTKITDVGSFITSIVLLIGVASSLGYFIFTAGKLEENKGFDLFKKCGLVFLFVAMSTAYSSELTGAISTTAFIIRHIIVEWIMKGMLGLAV